MLLTSLVPSLLLVSLTFAMPTHPSFPRDGVTDATKGLVPALSELLGGGSSSSKRDISARGSQPIVPAVLSGSEQLLPDTAAGLTTFTGLLLSETTAQDLAAFLKLPQILNAVFGPAKVQALDATADTLCIAQRNDGGLCQILAGWIAAFIYATENSYTFSDFAQALGPTRIAALNSNLNALCIGPETPGTTCDVILGQTDRFANALIGVEQDPDHGGSDDIVGKDTLQGIVDTLVIGLA
ncbi:hypothetical protein P7C73_g2848, partial [Tremellales sp. Uapishka_1]